MGFLGSKGIVNDEETPVELSNNRCNRMIQTENYRGSPMINVRTGVWRTNNTLNLKYEYCCTDVCSVVENALIQLGNTFDGHTVSSNLGDVSACQAQSGSCVTDDHSTIIWKSIDLKPPCPYVTNRIDYSVERSGSHYMITDIQQAFTRTKNLTVPHQTCLPQQSLMMDQGFILQLMDKAAYQMILTGQRSRTRRLAAPKLTQPPELLPGFREVNTRLQYLEEHIQQYETIRFKNIWTKICRLADIQLQIVRQLLYLDATIAARLWLKRTDVAARVAGEALLVWPCTTKTADFIFWNYKVGTECYALLPVVVNETVFFALPGSEDLVTTAPKVPCYQTPSGVRLDRNSQRWMTRK